MYAIVEIKGKQYKAEEGAVLTVDYLGEETKKIDDVKVLLYVTDRETKVGAPYLSNISVECSILENIKADKVVSIRYKRKTNEKTVKGHRQKYTKIKVDKISSN